MKKDLLNVWLKGSITSIKPGVNGSEKLYRIRLDNPQRQTSHKTMPAKYLAYENPAPVIIPVGTRIIGKQISITMFYIFIWNKYFFFHIFYEGEG